MDIDEFITKHMDDFDDCDEFLCAWYEQYPWPPGDTLTLEQLHIMARAIASGVWEWEQRHGPLPKDYTAHVDIGYLPAL